MTIASEHYYDATVDTDNVIYASVKVTWKEWGPSSQVSRKFSFNTHPSSLPLGQFLHGSLMDFNYITVLEGRKVLTGKDDGHARQNKWLIQGHAGNLMLRQEQSVSSLSSS